MEDTNLTGEKKRTTETRTVKPNTGIFGSVQPLTENQKEAFSEWFSNQNLFLCGVAGTGKTFLGVYLSLLEIQRRNQSRLIIVRSAVPSRDVGFLPGTYEEKIAQFEAPYIDICEELYGTKTHYAELKEKGLISFKTTSYIRGVTFDNAIILIDEAQNMTFSEIDSVMTRVGKNSRVIICGDNLYQNDLKLLGGSGSQTGIDSLVKVLGNIPSFTTVKFTRDDIVRSEFVKNWIVAREETGV